MDGIIKCPATTFQNEKDNEYADWCLENNWNKLDREAGLYVCGDDFFDYEYEEDLVN